MSDIRSQLRGQIFAAENAKVQNRKVVFFGATIELRQSTLGQTLEAQANEDREAAVIDILIRRAFVPDTDVLVFEEADADSLKAMPFGADFIRVSSALEEMTGVDFRSMANKAKEGQSNQAGNETVVGTEEA